MEDPDDATRALKGLVGAKIRDREIRVEVGFVDAVKI